MDRNGVGVMAKGDFARLRKWAEGVGYEVDVTQPGTASDRNWHVSVQLTDPVKFRASASDPDIDAAAERVIVQLVTVGEVLA
jgi:hypothetical protein